MKHMAIIVLIMVMLCGSAQARDATITGNEVMKYASATQETTNMYLIGVFQTLLELGFVCVQDGVTNGQVVEMIFKYLRDNPDKRHNTIAVITMVVIESAWGSCWDQMKKK